MGQRIEYRAFDPAVRELLADIESFDIEAARRRVAEADAKHHGLRVSNAEFPDLMAPVLPRLNLKNVTAAAAREDSTVIGGLLKELRREVTASQQKAERQLRKVGHQKHVICSRLRAVFDYLRELMLALNYLRPAHPGSFFLFNSGHILKDLTWEQGWSDFRSQASDEGGGIEAVTLSHSMVGKGSFDLERMDASIEKTRRMLFDLGLKFNCQERKNARGYVEHARFSVANEVQAAAVWKADFEKDQIVLTTRNIDRLGHQTYILQPEAVGEACLNEFGLLLLGQRNQFRKFVLDFQ